MKTINSQIDVFDTLTKAERAFAKTNSADLLSAKLALTTYYYVDKSKTAIKSWPLNYTLLQTK